MHRSLEPQRPRQRQGMRVGLGLRLRLSPRALALSSWLRELSLDLLALLWPTMCVGCGFPDRELCQDCAREVRGLPVGLEREGVELRPADFHGVDFHGVGAPFYAAGSYDGVVREMLLAYKHRGAYRFVRPLGNRLGAALGQACAGTDASTRAREWPQLLVTVPSRAQRVRERGFRHVDALVRVGVKSAGLRLERLEALRPLPGRTGQVGLDASARERNARRLFVPRRSAAALRGRDVILVDDIVTTGATVRAACEVLERAGARVVAIVALCVVVRDDTRRESEVESRR